MLSERYAALCAPTPAQTAMPGASGDASLIVELVFAAPLPPDEVAARIAVALPGRPVTVDPAFGGETDRFHFATFPGLEARGREPQAFAFARALSEAVGASEANPVLEDSLYGAAALGADETESFISLCETPRVNLRPFGWVHPRLRTPQAWAQTRGKGSLVAVIDTGYSSHQELNGVIRSQGQLNLVEGGTDARDRFSTGLTTNPGHGTLVCSVIASRGTADASGATGGPGAITGAAPEADVLPIRAIRSVVSFRQTTIPVAIAHAVRSGAAVIAMALGGPTRVAATERALREAVAAGVVIVCAAGNCWPSVVFPAAYAAQGLCTAVAALRQDLTPWPKTGRGAQVTLSNFGENVWGAAKNRAADPDNGIRASQGTTLATSLTAGCAALWVARHGGRAALKAVADARGTTVQAMFVRCAVGGLTPPAVWNGARNLGAGLMDAERLLAAALPAGAGAHEALPDAALPPEGVEPTSAILVSHLALERPEALDDYGPAVAPFAGELLWLSYRAGARRRVVEDGLEALAPEAVLRPDEPSDELRAVIADRPALRALVRAF